MPGCSDLGAAKAAVVLKTVSQPVVNRQLLVRATEMCSRISESAQTLNHHAVTAAVLLSHAVHQQHAELVAATVTRHAVLQLPAELAAATVTHHAVLQLDAETAAATVTHLAVLQQDAAPATHHAVLQQDVKTVTHHAVLQQDAETDVLIHAGKPAVQKTAARLQS